MRIFWIFSLIILNGCSYSAKWLTYEEAIAATVHYPVATPRHDSHQVLKLCAKHLGSYQQLRANSIDEWRALNFFKTPYYALLEIGNFEGTEYLYIYISFSDEKMIIKSENKKQININIDTIKKEFQPFSFFENLEDFNKNDWLEPIEDMSANHNYCFFTTIKTPTAFFQYALSNPILEKGTEGSPPTAIINLIYDYFDSLSTFVQDHNEVQ